MTALVLDASVTLAWRFGDETGYAHSVRAALAEDGAITPGLWRMAVIDGLLDAEAAGEIDAQGTDAFLDGLAALPIEWVSVPTPMTELLALGRRHGLRADAALTLDLARDRGLSVATLEPALRAACAAEGVPLWQATGSAE